MSFETTIRVLKAASDPTRLRLLALLANGEATVGELQAILEHSQPRVSRHLRLLDEAGLVEKFRDGHWVYYRLPDTAPLAAFIDEVLALAGVDDERLAGDRAVLERVRQNRARDAWREPKAGLFGIAARPSPEMLAEALEECIGDGPLGDVLDIGCGSGALLQLLGRRARRAVGIDASRHKRLLARSRLQGAGTANCTVRNGDLARLPFADDSFDVVILDEVLNVAGQTLTALHEAGRVLRAAGRLLIVDRIRPVARQLRDRRGDARLIDNQLTAALSEVGYRVSHRVWFPGRNMEYALFAAETDNGQRRTGTHG